MSITWGILDLYCPTLMPISPVEICRAESPMQAAGGAKTLGCCPLLMNLIRDGQKQYLLPSEVNNGFVLTISVT